MRLRSRLALSFSVVIAVGAGTTYAFVRGAAESVFRSFVFSGDADKARVYAGILADYYSEKKSWEGAQAFLSAIPQFAYAMLDARIHGDRPASAPPAYQSPTISALLSDRIAVADPRGQIVADTSGKLIGTTHPAMHLARGIPIMVAFEREGTVLVGSMIDSAFTGANERFLGTIALSLLWATLLAAGIALLFGLLFAARVTRPIARLTRAVRLVSAGDLKAEVLVEGRDEISELSVSFNAMTEELARLEEEKRRIIADSAHELRTPVTLIRGQIEAMLDGVYPLDAATLRSVHEETLRLARLIDTLRELELIDSGELELSVEEVDVGEAARKAAAFFGTAAMRKRLRLRVEAPEPDASAAVIRADGLRLEEVLYNLLSNAIKYTPEGGEVSLRVEGPPGSDRVVVRVEDSGPGIPAGERARVFERFYRLDESRSRDSGGRGLGLAIASEIVKAHGGSIGVGDSELGGAAFVVSMPREPSLTLDAVSR